MACKKVLARLKKGKPAYENLKDQSLRRQKAYVEYSSEPDAEIEEVFSKEDQPNKKKSPQQETELHHQTHVKN